MTPWNGESLELKYSTEAQGLNWINIFIYSEMLLKDNFKRLGETVFYQRVKHQEKSRKHSAARRISDEMWEA